MYTQALLESNKKREGEVAHLKQKVKRQQEEFEHKMSMAKQAADSAWKAESMMETALRKSWTPPQRAFSQLANTEHQEHATPH